ncbi:MAG TPA: DUF4870 domain-containing protein [Trebonia sp.]
MISRVSHGGGADLAPHPTDTEELWATLDYLGAIFLGPLVPLGMYLSMRDRSAFLRYHTVQALNITLTCLLYAVSGAIIGALLAFANANDAPLIMGPVAAAGWLIMLAHLVLNAAAASRGDFRPAPPWICAPLVR